jgi:hypothetical protein
MHPKLPLLLDVPWPALVLFTERFFKEDRQIVEIEQAAYDAQGPDLNHESVSCDPYSTSAAEVVWCYGKPACRTASRKPALTIPGLM